MITAQQLKEETETNDIVFRYQAKEYVICWFNGIYHCGESGNDDSDVEFKTYEEMLEEWKINNKLLKDILSKIELV
ncbi:hypothetical protein [Zhenhengia yiwuensis]|uniref:Uncharacterized protein n=1 Tax=Zhenhengia yiwuensis TaxID=2763666 RepID=A0A926EM58_9FIRM|nr:hypothetical protein [Zhenhengia yiwuensis]MBC8581605.1 hypothetical protein [Zhenhengia yiwuensis]